MELGKTVIIEQRYASRHGLPSTGRIIHIGNGTCKVWVGDQVVMIPTSHLFTPEGIKSTLCFIGTALAMFLIYFFI